MRDVILNEKNALKCFNAFFFVKISVILDSGNRNK